MDGRPRFVTSTSLFDGHDAAINIFRRILQAAGSEVIHLGHHRSAAEIVEAAIEEDAHAVAVTSYQGGHLEFFRYMRALLVGQGRSDVAIFGGGGGTILPEEGERLMAEGITRIYSPDDGRRMGLRVMVEDMLSLTDTSLRPLVDVDVAALSTADVGVVARLISAAENAPADHADLLEEVRTRAEGSSAPVVGVSGTGGSGKSSLVDEIVRRFLVDDGDRTVAVISVDPTKRRTGGALLGDRIRMNSVSGPRAYLRSMATRQANAALSPHVADAIDIVRAAGFDLVILESSGIGQADSGIVDHADLSLYVMTPEYGAPSQLEKIDMLDFADLVVVNKADKQGAQDALRDVRKQFRRSRERFDEPDDSLPVHTTIASQFNDPGTTAVYEAVMRAMANRGDWSIGHPADRGDDPPLAHHIVPPKRSRYLSDIVETIGRYDADMDVQAVAADRLWRLRGTLEELSAGEGRSRVEELEAEAEAALDPENLAALEGWDDLVAAYRSDSGSYRVRGRTIEVDNAVTSLSGTRVPKVAMPRIRGWGDRLRWLAQENVPGRFPFTAGVYPYKRTAEDPTRMFAGEGGPEETNRRFHYLSRGMPAARLSTAFDSVTLYGADPATRPDIYGKVGNSGVSVATLDDAKKLYSGFRLTDPATSVSMTINGPAPMILAFFLNAAIDQECEIHIRSQGLTDRVEAAIERVIAERGGARPRYRGDLPDGHDGLGLMLLGVTGEEVLPADTYAEITARALRAVRGTVQADILKEDQAQNTCIFSTEFALRLMGDVQEWFIEREVRNFYSVSISGYHISEAGGNPITQLAFTLANGFTYVEYYLARGMAIDDFAPNLSFFFSNGMDPEYAVIGRVARRIWAKAMKLRYGADERSQKLKYHVQTSGRSLHAQEIAFNDIRTTLQALYAVYDNCNSLHTNAFDEAVTTPTEASVRRALAIQLIINKELGLAANENPLQGSFLFEELTDLVEEAVLLEFERLSVRGGVLGAMERMYQRSKIQEESLHYERLKESGGLALIGVNTFLSPSGSPIAVPDELIRSTDGTKRAQIQNLAAVHQHRAEQAPAALARLGAVALAGGNVFGALMDAAKVCSLAQLSDALYAVGGAYRRAM